MPDILRSKRDVLTVFIASPGDLQEERAESRKVVDRLNQHLARNLELHVDLRGWEDTVPGTGRPQSRINEDMRDADLFIGLISQRWGTPTGQYSSGFEEEFELAREARRNGDLEDVWLFFKELPDEITRDPGEQLRRVLAFKQQMNAQRDIFYKTFSSTEDWSDKLYDYLANYLTRKPTAQEIGHTGETTESEQAVLGGESDDNDLLQSLSAISEAVRNDEVAEVDSFQSSRTYLTSLTLLYLKKPATQLMGTHENQLLYRSRRRVHLIPAEQGYVLRNLVADTDSVSAGWFWITRTPTELANMLLAVCSLDGVEKVKVGAMRIAGRIDSDIEFRRLRKIVDKADSLVASTILEVYGQIASESGVKNLEEYLEHESSELAEAAWRAILAILARYDPDRAINWLIEPTPLRRGPLISAMAPVWGSASKSNILALLDDKLSLFRLKAFEVVKDDLDEDRIRKVAEDPAEAVRAAAFLELVRRSVEIPEEELKGKLEGIESQSYDPSGGIWEGDTFSPFYGLNDVLLEHYQRLPYENLDEGIGWFSSDGELKYEALGDRYFDRVKDTLRSDISQDFQRLKDHFYAERRNILRDAPGGARDKLQHELIDQFRDLDHFRFERYLRAAYRVLAKHAEPDDLRFARSLLSDLRAEFYRVELVQATLEIIKRYGDMQDVELLKPLLSEDNPEVVVSAAELILQLAPNQRNGNVQYLLDMDVPEVTRAVLRYSLKSHDGKRTRPPRSCARACAFPRVSRVARKCLAYEINPPKSCFWSNGGMVAQRIDFAHWLYYLDVPVLPA